jgi:hypothetical protein
VKYNNKRWLNEESFEHHYPKLSPMFDKDKVSQAISQSINSFSSADTNEGNIEVANMSGIVHENLLHDSDKEDECAAKPDHCVIPRNVPDISNVQLNRKHCKESVTYNHLISQVTTLCETVQNSQHHCKMVGNFIGRWIDKLRTKEIFTVEFL